jgi:hypothetical protein
VNESLCRALIAAGLGEEDVAARLDVDPKTVRRWLEGRVPFRRYRWALAAMLGVSDGDLWPGLSGGSGRPAEVVEVYPHRDLVPAGVWLRLLGSARQQIGVLVGSGIFLARQQGLLHVMKERARTGTRLRICLRDPNGQGSAWAVADDAIGERTGGALTLYAPLAPASGVQVRLHRGEHYGSLVMADEEMLVVQRVYGVPAGRCPVLRLRRCGESGLFGFYWESFERVWAGARPLG